MTNTIVTEVLNAIGDSPKDIININADFEEVICIAPCAAMPSLGRNKGVFTGVSLKPITDPDGKVFTSLTLTVTLDDKDDDGVPFKVTKAYNVSTSRGKTAFSKACARFLGRAISSNDLKAFKTKELMTKATEVEVKYRKEGSKTVAYMADFFPIAAEAKAAS
jgi:hypothetical protein